jgi:hypothetical protein
MLEQKTEKMNVQLYGFCVFAQKMQFVFYPVFY